ncbi:MAG: hypothetical protein ACOYKZ_05740, partial [Chlamydiia bacterium]
MTRSIQGCGPSDRLPRALVVGSLVLGCAALAVAAAAILMVGLTTMTLIPLLITAGCWSLVLGVMIIQRWRQGDAHEASPAARPAP